MLTKITRKSELSPTLRSFDEMLNNMLKQFDPFYRLELPSENHSFGHMTLDTEDDKLTARIPLPGCKKEHISVEIQNDILSVKACCGACVCEDENKKHKLIRHERHYETFEESIKLPFAVDAAKTKAYCKHGILNVEMFRNPSDKNQIRIIDVK